MLSSSQECSIDWTSIESGVKTCNTATAAKPLTTSPSPPKQRKLRFTCQTRSYPGKVNHASPRPWHISCLLDARVDALAPVCDIKRSALDALRRKHADRRDDHSVFG